MTASFLEAPGMAELFGQARRSANLAMDAELEPAVPWAPDPHSAYQSRPLDWMVDKLGVDRASLQWTLHEAYKGHKWDGTVDPFIVVLDALGTWERVIGVESGNTTGKTWLGGRLVLWFFACFRNSITVTVAPKEDQLTKHIWKEINAAWPAFARWFPTAYKGQLSIQMVRGDENWAITGFTAGVSVDEAARSATRAQGFHAEHMLIVTEETPGIHPAVMAALKLTCGAPHNVRLAFGNPDHQLDPLHQLCTSPNAVAVRISALDHPNIVTQNPHLIPGAISQIQLDERTAEYGEEHPLYQSRVRGLSPSQAVNSLIRLEWLVRASGKSLEERAVLRRGLRSLGVDAAQSMNGDKAAIARGEGAVLEEVVAFQCPNATELGRTVVGEALRDGILPQHIGIDPVGVGAATANEVTEKLGFLVQLLNGGASPIERSARAPDGASYEWVTDANQFNNLRSQMAWQLREDLRNDRLALPRDPALFRQLMLLKYEPKNGKTVVVPKDKVKEAMGGQSPNEADAVMYWNWARYRAPTPVPEPVRVNPLERDTTDFHQPAPPAWYDTLAQMPSDF